MYNAFKSIAKSKKIFVIAVIQLALGLSLLNYTTAIISISKNKVDKFKNMFDFETTYLTRVKDNRFESLTSQYGNLQQVYNEFEKLKDEDIVKSISVVFSTSCNIEELSKKVEDIDKLKNLDDSDKMYYLSEVLVNNEYVRNNALKVVEGRTFTEEDFNIDPRVDAIPILVGNDYKGKVKIGDTFEQEVRIDVQDNSQDLYKVKFEIIGILDINQLPTIFSKQNLITAVNYSNGITVIPTMSKCFYFSEGVVLGDFGVFITIKDNSKFSLLEKRAKEITTEYNHDNCNMINMKEDLESNVGNLERGLYQSVILGIVLTFLSVVGIASVMIGNLNGRKKEFGIKISQGASIKTLSKEIFYEVILTVLWATILSLIILFFRKLKSAFTIELILANIVFITIITILIALPIVLKVRKMNVVDLVRGE